MSVIMNPELRIGAVLLARAARAGCEMGEGEERGGESCCCLTDACNVCCFVCCFEGVPIDDFLFKKYTEFLL